jgi:TfoX/Sxy family transcriptional regulator of competence genes
MLDELDACALSWRRVSKRRMFGADCYLVEGRMFAFWDDTSLVLKLPPADRDRLLARPDASPFLMRPGVPFGEWVQWRLPPGETELALSLLQSAFDYVSQLRPARPTHRRRRW